MLKEVNNPLVNLLEYLHGPSSGAGAGIREKKFDAFALAGA